MNKGERPTREQVATAIRAVNFQGLGVRAAFNQTGGVKQGSVS